MAGFGDCLVDTPPQRPSEEMIESYTGCMEKSADEMADFTCAEIDHRLRRGSPFFVPLGH
jgi:hypothetical protein